MLPLFSATWIVSPAANLPARISFAKAPAPELPGKKPAELGAAMLADEKKSMAPADMAALLADVQKSGDPARGEAVYRRKDQSCLKCHAIAGAFRRRRRIKLQNRRSSRR